MTSGRCKLTRVWSYKLQTSHKQVTNKIKHACATQCLTFTLTHTTTHGYTHTHTHTQILTRTHTDTHTHRTHTPPLRTYASHGTKLKTSFANFWSSDLVFITENTHVSCYINIYIWYIWYIYIYCILYMYQWNVCIYIYINIALHVVSFVSNVLTY